MKKILSILLVTFLCLLSLGMTKQYQPVDLVELWKSAVMENRQLKQQNSDLRLQIAEYRLADKNDKIALFPMGYFKADNHYARDPEHFRKVWSYCQKYQYLLGPEVREICKKQDIDPVKFAFTWSHKESHYSPLVVNVNKNGTRDWGMNQINDCVWDILYVQLPENLKKIKNPKTDTEISVCMLYLWMSDRTKNKMSWCFLNDESWTIYWFIGEIERNG